MDLNTGVVLGEGSAVVIDPPSSPAVTELIEKGLRQAGSNVEAIVLTHSSWDVHLGSHVWPDATRITADTLSGRTSLTVSIEGWEARPLNRQGAG